MIDGNRKLIVALFAMISATGLLVFDKLPANYYPEVMIGIAGLYIAGNVAAKFSTAAKTRAGESQNGG